MTHWNRMRFAPLLLLAVGSMLVSAQTGADELEVYAEHPRLLLKPQRLRLLRRERDRASARWQQFDGLVSGGAQMSEPGFAFALHYQVTSNVASGKKAIEWALGANRTDLRQLALVFDWCQPLLTEPQSRQLLSKLTAPSVGTAEVSEMTARALAAIAAAGHGAPAANTMLGDAVHRWWKTAFAPALRSGTRVLSHSEVYPTFEFLHAVRDNLQIDLRENAPAVFKELPAERLLSYYPATYPAAENEFRIPYFDGKGEPDLRIATMARVAELSMVAYDNNAVESQFLQGWLMHDRFLLRGPTGIAYEFLWANPYQPGLGYQHMPLRFHDSRAGRLFLRSSWEEDATWAGYASGRLQIFHDGKIQAGAVKAGKPLTIGDTGLAAGPAPLTLELRAEDPPAWFVVGLIPNKNYDVEAEDEELAEARADRGGIIPLPALRSGGLSVRIRQIQTIP